MKKLLLISAALLSLKHGYGQCPTPTLVTATPSIICAGATTSLNATAVGHSINWYTVPVSGIPIGVSASAANYTLNPSITTTYYAESFLNSNTTFSYTGSAQQFIIPVGVTQVTIQAYGAQGGTNALGVQGGLGGMASGVLNVTPGQTLNIFVGGSYGYNGGGLASNLACPNAAGGNGGGASDVRLNGISLGDRVIVAGGGGGAAGDRVATCGRGSGGGGGGGYYGGGGGAAWPQSSTQLPTGGDQVTGGIGGTSSYTVSSPNSNGFSGSLGLGGNGGSEVSSNQAGNQAGATGGVGGGNAGANGIYAGNFSGQSGAGGSSYTGTLSNVATVSGTNTGNGSVIITAAGCISASRTAVTVSVNPNPTVSVNSGSVCLGNSFTISPSGANTYTIQGGNAVVSPTINSTYTVAGTSTAGCKSQVVTSTVTVNALPLPTVSVNSGSICSGSSFTMVPTGASTYTFQGGNAVVSPTANASYTVVGTNSAGCVSNTFAISSITVQASPSVSVTGAGTICIGQATVLTASGANTYSWNTGATTASILVSPSVTTSYTTTGTSSVTGCSGITVTNLVVSSCAGVTNIENEIEGLSIYPNPSNGNFTIELNNSKTKQIVITDNTGKMIKTMSTKDDVINVSLDQFANGIYHVKVESNNATKVVKISKQ